MTFKQFLKELKSLNRTWYIREGALRSTNGDCPLVAVQSRYCRTPQWTSWPAADRLGLSYGVADRIIKLSDNMNEDGDRLPRRYFRSKAAESLFRACGLKVPR